MPHDKRKTAARAIMAETGMTYVHALREADRRHAAAKAARDEQALLVTRTLEADPDIEPSRAPLPEAVFMPPEQGPLHAAR